MALFTRAFDLLLLSRYSPRYDARAQASRTSARSRIIAALVAAVVFISAAGAAAHARLDAGSSLAWNDAPAGQVLPFLHSHVLRQADHALSSQRRSAQQHHLLLASDASPLLARIASRAGLSLRERSQAVAGFLARGYDATAPPVS